MAATLLTIAMITRETLRVLENNLTFTKLVNRNYDDRYAIEGAKIGTVLNIRKPTRYTVSSGQALDLQDTTDTQTPVVLDQQKHVDFQFSSADLLLSIDDFSKRYLVPAVAALANKIDADGLALYKKVWNSVGAPATVPNALLTYLLAGVKLDDNAAPMDGQRNIVINPLMQATIVDALRALFQSSSDIASQYRKGQMGTAAGFDWAMDQNCAAHTVGTYGGTPLVNGASQTGSSLATDGWTSGGTALKEGDIFTIAGVNMVNPQSRQSTGSLQQFRVRANTSDSSGAIATLPIEPSIITSGPFQTVTASPADDAAITMVGASAASSPQGLAFHKDAFTLVTADLPLPKGVDMADRVSSKKLGVSMRVVRAYDVSTDNFPCRLDVLYGWAPLRPELACRIQS